MKLTQSGEMRFGKVEFTLTWMEEFPFELTDVQTEAFNASRASMFNEAKTGIIAQGLRKEYAKLLDMKPTAFKTEMADDPIELEKCFKAAFPTGAYSASEFKVWQAQSEGQVSVAKVLAWLQGLDQDMTVADVLGDHDAASLKAEIVA